MPSPRTDPAKRHYRLEEMFVQLALRLAFPRQAVHLHPALAAVDLAPDLVVGSMSSPRVVVGVTRLSAQNAVQVKAWRDLYELLLYRRQHPRTRVLRVLFGEPGAASWNRALERVFDLHLFVRGLDGGAHTERLLHRLTAGVAGVPAKEAASWLEARLDATARCCLARLAGHLAVRGPVYVLPEAPCDRTLVTEPFHPTALRRAVVLLGIFPELARLPPISGEPIPAGWLESMGFMGGDGRLAEPWRGWVEGARGAVGRRALTALVEEAVAPSRRVRTRMLQSGRTLAYFETWYGRLAAFARPGRHLARALRLPANECAACGGHPALLALRNLLKLDGGDTFGNARLLAGLGLGRDTSDLYRVSRWFSGEEPPDETADWDAVWPWFERAFALLRDTPGVERRLVWPLFYDEAMKNRQVDPLGRLLRIALDGQGSWQARHPTFLDPAGGVATVRCWRLGDTVYHWKSAHDGHRDKTKELAAKGVAMRAVCPGERFVLVIDGDFCDRDLSALAAAGGWDLVLPVSSWQREGAAALRASRRR